MSKLVHRCALVFCFVALCVACDEGDGDGGTADGGAGGGRGGAGGGGGGDVLLEAFGDALMDATLVDCTLTDGTTTTCHQLTFAANPTPNGPYCPATIDDIGGLGIYDGETNPGFQVMKRSLWEAMEADGYDIVDDEGNVRVVDPGAGPVEGDGTGFCLEATPDDSLVVTYTLPVDPVMADSPTELGTVQPFGIALDGVPLTGDPPSVVSGPPMMGGGPPGGRFKQTGGGGIPALDPCGGHMDPAGYYHWHFVGESINAVLDAFEITEVSCTNVPQRMTGLVGFARDGFPVYAPYGDGDAVPAGLDACNGKVGVTPEYPEGIYHYYALETEAPNLPGCLVGAAVESPLSVR